MFLPTVKSPSSDLKERRGEIWRCVVYLLGNAAVSVTVDKDDKDEGQKSPDHSFTPFLWCFGFVVKSLYHIECPVKGTIRDSWFESSHCHQWPTSRSFSRFAASSAEGLRETAKSNPSQYAHGFPCAFVRGFSLGGICMSEILTVENALVVMWFSGFIFACIMFSLGELIRLAGTYLLRKLKEK